MSNRMLLLVLLSVTACVDDPVEDEVSFVESDLGWSQSYMVSSNGGQSPTHIYIGPTSDRTCFLINVRGVVDGIVGVSAEPLQSANPTSWYIGIGGNSQPVSVQVLCIPSTGNRVFLTTHFSSTTTAAATPNRHCFLTELHSYGAWQQPLSGGARPGTSVFKTAIGTQLWILDDDFVPNTGYTNAVCVDTGFTGVQSYHKSSTTSWESFNLVDNATGGWACGLSGMHGIMNGNMSTPGIEVSYNSPTDFWKIAMGSQKDADIKCVK